MKSIEEILFESELESFKVAAQIAKEHHTQLVFWEDGHLVKRFPSHEDIMGNHLKKIQLP
jgi:hypothetical protein